jgi:hypothetical protein
MIKPGQIYETHGVPYFGSGNFIKIRDSKLIDHRLYWNYNYTDKSKETSDTRMNHNKSETQMLDNLRTGRLTLVEDVIELPRSYNRISYIMESSNE